jgi:hypothetical protein
MAKITKAKAYAAAEKAEPKSEKKRELAKGMKMLKAKAKGKK